MTDEPGGTAFRAFSPLRAEGLHSAGKTGTAQFRQGAGRRVDSWFIGFAPADHPRIAYAVVVEGGGYGSQLAAPMAATIVEAALRTGLLAEPPALGEHQAALGADR